MKWPPSDRIQFSSERINKRVHDLGQAISHDYAGKELILISVLKGSLYFFADLTRAIDLPVQLDFISIGTYPTSTNQKGIVRITKDLDLEITGKHVILVEDIIRTGLTTGYLVQTLQTRMPASINVCTLLYNPSEQLINVPVAYSGFEITKMRLVGYGMDIQEQGRNLPYIAEIES
ncbi:MAG: hypoxanthine phosphoribosyltransferase [Clostridiaceae bacterium]|jgi:hypoxanthine phosphoribosyltransferase|nr:hypoxanthine phosphoribosyltransferase [Eubacteriales bacterium]NLV47117.1 hypoxanthine phosphoribosyltransferase [Clostridiaceae bacterium]